jgi:hypothetical protein
MTTRLRNIYAELPVEEPPAKKKKKSKEQK